VQDARYVPNESRTQSELVVPLRFGGQVIGVLDLQSDQPEAFDEQALRVITAFAERAELALANARLVARLNEALRMAEEANRLKSEFLANTSHELRTPLSGILGSLGLILNKEVQSPHEVHQFVEIAYDSARNLLTIVNDLLDFARIEAGKMAVHLEPVDVSTLLVDLRRLMWASASKKGLALEIVLPPAPVWAMADAERVKQVMFNLLGNAIKFTDHGWVRVTAVVEADQHRVRLAVVDTGIGIPLDKQGLLFRPFVQVDGSTTRRYGGTGLGLSISRRLAEMMGGTLSVYSAGAYQGSTFTFVLPLADPVN
jgi:signal transduction histidine kinase